MIELTIINLFLLFILLFFNINYFLFYVVNIILLIIVESATYYKKENCFILFSGIYIIESLLIPINKNQEFMLLIYYLISFILLILNFRYVFNLTNNKLYLTFKNLEIPKGNDFILAKCLQGPFKGINGNTIVKKIDDSFLISVEDSEGKIEEFKLAIVDIKKVDIIEKPYYKSVKRLEHGNNDYVMGHFESHRGFKIIKSYKITIKTNDTVIVLLSFNYPNILNFKE